ncbi:twin-arginine translocase subunit TatC [bacterium]|nr:twin-arginine translocase subunit TatC [bacterium]
MNEYDPYNDYTGYEPGTGYSATSGKKETSVPAEEDKNGHPGALAVFDTRRFFEINFPEPDTTPSSSYQSAGKTVTLAAVATDSRRVSIHPLGYIEKPPGVTDSYWTSLDTDHLLSSRAVIDSQTADNALLVTTYPGTAHLETSPQKTVPVSSGSSGGSGGLNGEKPKEEEPDPTEMPFLDHLEEFRWALLKSIFAVTIGMILGWFLSDMFISTITHLAEQAELPLIYTGIMEPIMIRLQTAFFMGLVMALPFVLYFIWSFVSPGLYKREKKWILPLVYIATLSFLIGASLAYFIIIPFFLKFVKTFKIEKVLFMLTIGDFISKMLRFTIMFGVIFEMPLITFILAKIGIIKYTWMTKYRKYAIVIIFVVAAIFTPPDPASQIIMAIPLLFLYEISVLVARIAGKKTLL